MHALADGADHGLVHRHKGPATTPQAPGRRVEVVVVAGRTQFADAAVLVRLALVALTLTPSIILRRVQSN